LYSLEGHQLAATFTAVLISLSWCNPHSPGFLYNKENGNFSLQGYYILCAATSSCTLLAKHPCRESLADNHSSKVIKKTSAINSHPACKQGDDKGGVPITHHAEFSY